VSTRNTLVSAESLRPELSPATAILILTAKIRRIFVRQ